MANGKPIPINVINFDGDFEILPFFFDQIRSVAKINKYNDQTAITLLKSKLSGSALKFLTQRPDLLKSNDLDYIEKEFLNFFSPQAKPYFVLNLIILCYYLQNPLKTLHID